MTCDLTTEQNSTSPIHRGHCAKTFELLQPRCALVASEAAVPHYKAMKESPLGLTALNRENGFKSPQDLKGDPLGVARPRLRQGATTEGGIFPGGAAKSPPRYENRARAGEGRSQGSTCCAHDARHLGAATPVALSTDCILNVIYFGSNGFRKTPLGFSFVRVQTRCLCARCGVGHWVGR